jgi:hypothetical protein
VTAAAPHRLDARVHPLSDSRHSPSKVDALFSGKSQVPRCSASRFRRSGGPGWDAFFEEIALFFGTDFAGLSDAFFRLKNVNYSLQPPSVSTKLRHLLPLFPSSRLVLQPFRPIPKNFFAIFHFVLVTERDIS